jgi:Ca-activated chloride channel family protein
MKKLLSRLALLTCFVLTLEFALRGNASQTPGAIRVEVHLVEVYATIYDHNGHYVDGLSQSNFEVLEDGKTQEIESFETSAQSLSCAILLDTTASMTEALPRVKNSIVKLIDELGPQDAVAVYTFDERLVTRQPFTSDKNAAKRAVLRTRAQGRTALFDAMTQASLDISKRPGKKTLIVFTDGDDNSSALNANAAVAGANRVGIPVYAIAEGEAVQSQNLKKLLDEMTGRTGGAAYLVKRSGDIEQLFHRIAQDLQHLYMISYQPPSSPADGKWHKIELVVKGLKDSRVRAKEGYFSD